MIHEMLDRSIEAASQLPEGQPENMTDAVPTPEEVEAPEDPELEHQEFPDQETGAELETTSVGMSEYPSLPVDEFSLPQESHRDHTEITQGDVPKLPHTLVELPATRDLPVRQQPSTQDRILPVDTVSLRGERKLPIQVEPQTRTQPEYEPYHPYTPEQSELDTLSELFGTHIEEMKRSMARHVDEELTRQTVLLDRSWHG